MYIYPKHSQTNMFQLSPCIDKCVKSSAKFISAVLAHLESLIGDYTAAPDVSSPDLDSIVFVRWPPSPDRVKYGRRGAFQSPIKLSAYVKRDYRM